jgi:hypothetical protein
MKNEEANRMKCPIRFLSKENSAYCGCLGSECMAWALDEGSSTEGHCRIIGSFKR